MTSHRAGRLAAAAAIAIAALSIYLLRLDTTAGLMVDDAWYILLARALADGRGYQLISSAATPILPLYPPGFPAILACAFRLAPSFPENVYLLKSLSIAAMLGTGALTWTYLATSRHLRGDLALCAAAAVTIVPAFVFLATSTVMSECAFTFAQLASVVLLHRATDRPDDTPRLPLLGSALAASAAMLIRTSGLGLLAASAIWLAKERRWRPLQLFAGAACLCLLPWMLYARGHAPTAAEREAHRGSVVYAYGDQFWMKWAGAPWAGRATPADIPARVATNAIDVFGRDVAGIIVPAVFRPAHESGAEVLSLGGRAGLTSGGMGAARATMVISFGTRAPPA